MSEGTVTKKNQLVHMLSVEYRNSRVKSPLSAPVFPYEGRRVVLVIMT
jgi:hypothetical protein